MKLSIFFSSLLVLCLATQISTAQDKRANVWTFGDKGMLDFNSGNPLNIGGSEIVATEGASSISDNQGNLLLYSNGVTVWNKNHKEMPNGKGLLGGSSSTQSCLIVPKPKSNNKYFLFTTDARENNFTNGLCYSEVDMTLDGGMGDVTGVKNISLTNNSSEKLSAVEHANGIDYWVVARSLKGNTWYVYLINETGVSSPVISNGGYIYDDSTYNGIGELKILSNGKKIAAAFDYTIEIFDFDNATGIISNPVVIPEPKGRAYSLEFSQQGRFLYCSTILEPCLFYQLDISSHDSASIYNSKTIIKDGANFHFGKVQLASNRKIYIKCSNYYLSVVNSPDSLGLSCNYQDNVVGVDGRLGLTNFVASFFKTKINLGTDTTFCIGDSAVFAVDNMYDTYLWHDGSTDTSFTAKTSGWVWLEVTKDGETVRDSVLITVNPLPTINLGNDTTVCAGESLIFDAGAGFTDYLWNDNSTVQTFIVNNAGSFFVKITDNNGCENSDTVNVTVAPLPTINLGNDTTLCNISSLVLDAGAGFVNYLWQDNSTKQTFAATTTGKYYVQVTDNNGCKNADTVNITFAANPAINLGSDTTICLGESVVFDAGAGFVAYLWQDNSTTQTFTATNAGSFFVKITDNNGCENSDTVNVTVAPLPTINLENDTTLCNIPSLMLDVGAGFINYLWQDNSTSQSFTVTTTGKYYVQVTDNNGCKNADTVNITFATIPVINLGKDTTVCNKAALILDAGRGFTTYQWQDNSSNQTFTAIATGIYHVKGTLLNGCYDQDTISITYAQLPVVNLINDTAFCASLPLEIDAGSGFASYLWSTGKTTQTIYATESGVYKVTVGNTCGTASDSLTVTIHPMPTITAVNTDQPATLIVSVLGGTQPYQYSLDSLVTYQTTNTFTPLDAGMYVASVRDANGCITQAYPATVTQQSFSVPNFFTPNGDGVNDTWEIAGISEYPDTEIMIFDRFSHLLVSYKGSDTGWNGMYNNQVMPMDDYWYVIVQKPSGIVYKGHVTIKR